MDGDSILEALDIIRDYAMERMLEDQEAGEEVAEPEAAVDDPEQAPPMDDEADPLADEDEEPHMSVMKRYDFVGSKLPKSNKVPVKRR